MIAMVPWPDVEAAGSKKPVLAAGFFGAEGGYVTYCAVSGANLP